jgi:hypothetical protein
LVISVWFVPVLLFFFAPPTAEILPLFFSRFFGRLVFDFQMFIWLFPFGLYLFVVLLCSAYGGQFAPFFSPVEQKISI